MRCLQAANTVGSLALVPAGAAAEVIAAGGVGAASALTLCNEAEITTAPNSLVANVPGDSAVQQSSTAAYSSAQQRTAAYSNSTAMYSNRTAPQYSVSTAATAAVQQVQCTTAVQQVQQ